MEGASTSRGPSKPNRNVIINAQKLFGVLHEDSIFPQDKLKLITELLKVVDVDINFPDGYDKRNTLLHGAVSYGYVDLVKLLLQNGAAVNITNAEGETPFHIAVAHGNVYMVRLILLAKKPDVSQQKVDVKVQKVDVNIKNAKGETPLHLVLSDRKINKNKSGKPIVQMLLGCKADVNIKNSDGKTLLDMAKEKKDETIIALLGCRNKNSSLVEVNLSPDNNITHTEANIAEATGRENKVQKVTDAFAKLPETYSSSGAKLSMHGTVYQLRLLMLFAIRALVMGYRFHLGTEVDEAEQFDDLVFKYQLPNTDSLKHLLLQAKSKANNEIGINLEDLLDEDNKAQFSLLKYYKSFIKIRASRGLEADDFDFAICTNTHFNFGEPGVLVGNGKKLSFYLVTDICEGLFKEGHCYKLVMDEETLKWLKIDFAQKWNKEKEKLSPNDKKNMEFDYILSCLNDTHSVMLRTFKIFLNKLIFVVGQTADIEVVKTEFREYSKINHPDTKLHTDAFYKRIFDWFSQKEGVWLTNGMVKEMIGSICDNVVVTSVSQVYVEKSQSSNIKFNTAKLEELNERISGNKIVNLITPVETKLTLLHVAQALECSSAYKAHNFIFIHFSSLLLSETQERTIRAFESPRNNNLLVIDCLSGEKVKSTGNLTKLQEDLRDIITKNTLKQIILISPEDHVLSEMFQSWPGYYSQHVKYVFEDFTKETHDVFLTTKVKFQGQSIELNQVIGETETDLLQIVPLEALIADDGLVIGKTPSATSNVYNESYYIDRYVQYQTVMEEKISEDKSQNKFNDEIALSEHEFQQLCSTHKDANIHWIEKQDDKFIWVKSQGKLNELRPYFDNDNTKCCSEELFLDLVKRQRVVIISDSAGTGKSTILSHISKIIQTERQRTLVLRIELNNHTKALQEQRENTYSSTGISLMKVFLEFLQITTPFEEALLKRNGKAIWMFDGFDEISPDYKETVLDFIRYLIEATESQIWITTRPFISAELEKELHQRSYRLNAFSKSNQIDFLIKFWKQMKKNQNSEEEQIILAESIINKFSASISDKEREFTGIPLQMRILAECFDDDFVNSPEWEKCLNLVELYDIFIKKKLNVFHAEKNNVDDSIVGAKEELEEKFNDYEKYHIRIALLVISPENLIVEQERPIRKRGFKPVTINILNRIGIVHVIDGKHHFIHRTFAEYFVATYSVELCKKNTCINTNEQYFMFTQVLVHDKYKQIRVFLNGLLSKEQPNFESPKKESRKMLEINLEKGGNESEFLKHFNNSCLSAAGEGNEQIILYALNYAVEYPTVIRNLLQCNETGSKMLHLAINNDDTVFIKTLLKWTRDNMDHDPKMLKQMLLGPNEVLYAASKPLIRASKEGRKDVVLTLLQWTRDNVKQGEEIVVEMLLSADIDGYTALNRASLERHNDVVLTILHWTLDKMKEGQEIAKQMLLGHTNKDVTILIRESYQGDNGMVQKLLQWTLDNMVQGQMIVELMLTTANKEGITPLIMASIRGYNNVVQTLLKWTRDNMDQGQDIVKLMLLETDEEGITALIWASLRGHNDVVQTLLQWTSDNMDQWQEIVKQMLVATNKESITALILASIRGHSDVVQTLLQWTGDMCQGQEIVKQVLLATNKEGLTALFLASLNGHNDVLLKLLQWTRDNMAQWQEIVKQMLVATNKEGITALIIASIRGHSDVVQTLLQWTRDNMDQNQEIVRLMLLATNNEGTIALIIASLNGNNDVVQTLLQWTRDNIDQGQELVKQMLLSTNVEGVTALIIASIKGHKDVVQTLLQWTRDNIDQGQEIVKQMLLWTNEEGITALIIASINGHNNVVQTLLQWTHDNMGQGQEVLKLMLLATNREGIIALIIASIKGHNDIVQTLLQWTRYNIDQGQEIVKQMLLPTNEEGITALFMASITGHNDVVKTLLQWTRDNMDQGQDIVKPMLLATNKQGFTALILASITGHNEVVQTLLQWTLENMCQGQEIVKQMLLARNKEGITALIMASMNGHNAVMQTLLQWTRYNMDQGQDIVKRMLLEPEKEGITALIVASITDHNDVVQTLLQWTRDNMDEETLHELLTAGNKNGKTALDLAEEKLMTKNVEILKKYARPV